MTDFRALCADLLDEVVARPLLLDRELITRARAALADEPAVPKGREPVAVTGQPSDEEIMGLMPQQMHEDLAYAARAMANEAGTDNRKTKGFMRVALNRHAVDLARAVLTRWGNAAPAPPADVSQLSDGYHTFAELYEHRYSLMLALMRALPRICWFSRRHADGELPFGSDDWFIVGAELPGAPITYHLPAALYSLAQKTGALELPAGRPWDGHSAADVVHRLRDWAIAPTPPADGEVAELEAWLRETGDLACQADAEEGQRYWSAADLLQQRHPAPVPVSERLPGPGEMTEDGEVWVDDPGHDYPIADSGDYGWEPHKWIMRPISRFDAKYGRRWLPAHALPVPEVSNG